MSGRYFYSQSALNGGNDQMVAYAGQGQTMNWPSGSGLWSSGEIPLAFEDLPLASSDKDYNDFMALVESVHPVPEPGTLGLLGLGLAGIGFVGRRRKV